MASIVSSVFGQSKSYEPSPRFNHYAAPVGGKCFLWGGHVPDFSASGRKRLASNIEIFDPYLEMWEQQATSGVSPPGVEGGVCASLSDKLYSFGGEDGTSLYGSLHTLETTTLEWKLQVLNQADAPMRKIGCGMVAYKPGRLALFGGYGVPTGPTQPGATFVKNTGYTDGRGWSNELHIFNINADKWSIPTTTGLRPPPCESFSFTALNGHRALLFGGLQPLYGNRVNDCYVVDFDTMGWTKLERPEGAPWPAERIYHAACCLNYAQDEPQVLVTGGGDNYGKTLNDMWILDVKSGRWRKLNVPEGTQPRWGHTVTSFSLGPGRTQVTMFGGCPKWRMGKSDDSQLKLAETTVLEFESVETTSSGDGPPTREWVLVGVAGSSQLGSNKRIREKIVNLRHSAVQEFKAGRQALQASQAAERFLEGALQESQAEKRALAERVFTSEQRLAIADRNVREAEERVRYLQLSVDEANTQTEGLQRRLQYAEHRAEEAERRARDAGQGASEGEPSWVVQRDEINFTDIELGRGGWAVVRVAEFRGVRCAAKCLYRQIISNYNRVLFTREMNMASRVRHPNLLQFIGATLRGELIILTELMPTSVRGELENERIFSQQQINSIGLDVARALNYLHLMQPSPIIHRDISSANVLLEPGPNNSWKAKVSDYGSVNLYERLRTAAPGNPTYSAPEAGNVALQSPQMDIFSFGVLLVEMCSAQFPEVADRERLIRSIRHTSMVALIRQCLAVDRNARPSARDIITELSEPHDD